MVSTTKQHNIDQMFLTSKSAYNSDFIFEMQSCWT